MTALSSFAVTSTDADFVFWQIDHYFHGNGIINSGVVFYEIARHIVYYVKRLEIERKRLNRAKILYFFFFHLLYAANGGESCILCVGRCEALCACSISCCTKWIKFIMIIITTTGRLSHRAARQSILFRPMKLNRNSEKQCERIDFGC